MAVDFSETLVVAIASSALFNLSESDRVFREQGAEAYEAFQRERQKEILQPGPAFQFIKRLLSLNDIDPDSRLVEVIVASRNSPTSGLRVMESVKAHGLDISRAVFREGQHSHQFFPVLNVALFLSGNKDDVEAALNAGLPAGHVLPSGGNMTEDGTELRIAFDFDGVLADDTSERQFLEDGLTEYSKSEEAQAHIPLQPGPLKPFLSRINKIQRLEQKLAEASPDYVRRLRVSLVTARNAPAHERAIRSLMEWNVAVDDAFFLGGLPKTGVLNALKPHIFFDDQLRHLKPEDLTTPAVHIPFGVHNQVG